MANPQIEEGYTRIANEILGEVMKLNLNGTQFRLVMAIWRYTYGFQRKGHEMSLSFLVEAISASRSQVTRELNALIDKRIIVVVGVGKGGSRKLGFNKNHTEWERGTLNRVYPNPSTEVYSNQGTEVYSNPSTKKERTKERIKDTRQSKKYDEDNTYFKMAIYFHERVSRVANDAGIAHLIKKSNMQTWADDMRKLVEIDMVDKQLAKKVMDWVTEDSFWRTNVLSAKKLREKFMDLAIKMNAEKQPQQPKNVYDPRDKEIAFQQHIQNGGNPDEFDWSR
ncbi:MULTISPECIES: replication protein [unclassified Sporosarcina]|uniref:replication protein n=1 Tax=unclassified Sporosarcina TaxID=2647733 RepID=UPI002041E190|nr:MULTISPECIES: replication protein [unclassified Sporosarcina]GKV66719.1 hypothetical protein NCCP2331_28720 [Sporosarcina sp. NCCP-2331]GLB57098.1 hypothetical protein NCCP2378_28850 [Sporosarcina sp. NCCP-2378]